MSIEMIEFSKRLNQLADESGIAPKGQGRQLDMAKLFGVSQKGARKWLEGEAMPRTAKINEIAKHFRVNSQWLLSGQGEKEPAPNVIREELSQYNISSQIKKETTRLPIISDVQAGLWKEVIDNFHPGDADEWIETTAKVSHHSFALRVTGDSMVNPYGSPSIPNGSIVIIDPDIAAINGKIVVAKLLDSNEAILKKLVIDGPNRYLKSLNPDYKPISIDENCLIIGVAKRIEIDI